MMLHTNAFEEFARGPELLFVRAEDIPARLLRTADDAATHSSFSAEEEMPAGKEEEDTSLDEAAETERDYVRRRLRDELGRNPSEEEVDEWLRRHTEGY